MSKREVDDMAIDDEIAGDALAAYREAAERSGATDTPIADKAINSAKSASTDREPEDRDVDVQTKDDDANGSTPNSRKLYPGRRPDGKFAKKDEVPGAEVKTDAPAVSKPADAAAKPAEGAVKTPDADPAAAAKAIAGPPPSWSVKSKATWDQLPAEVKDDILKREQENAQGLAALRDFKELTPYATLAKQHNTTIKAALDNYLGIENMLKQDIGKGLAQILENFGLKQEQAATLFADLARRYGGKPSAGGNASPAGGAHDFPNPNNDPLLAAIAPALAPILDRINAFEGKFTGQQQAQVDAANRLREQQLTSQIEQVWNQFASDPANRFVPELQETMIRLLETGLVPKSGNHAADLKAAYDLAAYQHPEVREALIEQRLAAEREAARKAEQEKVERARSASRSITGNRIPGTQIREPVRADTQDDIEADVRAAYASARRS